MNNPHSNEKPIPDLPRYPLEQIGSAEKEPGCRKVQWDRITFLFWKNKPPPIRNDCFYGAKTAVLITNTGIDKVNTSWEVC